MTNDGRTTSTAGFHGRGVEGGRGGRVGGEGWGEEEDEGEEERKRTMRGYVTKNMVQWTGCDSSSKGG